MSKMNNRVGDNGKDKQSDYDMHIIQADSLDDALQMLGKVLCADLLERTVGVIIAEPEQDQE